MMALTFKKYFCQFIKSKNYYQILDIGNNSSNEEIKKAFYKKAKLYHPDTEIDKNNSKQNEEKFKELTNAYEILSNSELKKKYDIEYNSNTNNKDFSSYYNESYSKGNYYTDFENHDDYKRNYYNQKEFYYKRNTNQKSNYSDPLKNSNKKEGKYFIYIDPKTGIYYKVYADKSFYDNFKNDDRNSKRYSNYQNPYNDYYPNNDEEYFEIKFYHLFSLFLIIATSLYYLISLEKKKRWESDAVLYKNTIYYPKNKDPIISNLQKKGYVFPEEISSRKS